MLIGRLMLPLPHDDFCRRDDSLFAAQTGPCFRPGVVARSEHLRFLCRIFAREVIDG